MTAAEWTALVVAAIGAIGVIVLQALQMYFSYKHGEKVETKLDNNTRITEEGNKTSIRHAAEAVNAVDNAKNAALQVASSLEQKLNGGVDAAIAPLREAFDDYVARNESNMRELRAALSDLRGLIKTRS